MTVRTQLSVLVVMLVVALAACGPTAPADGPGGKGIGGRDPTADVGNVGTACVTNAECTQSYCNGTWREGQACKSATDCPGYVRAAGGYQPPAPNKRCIDAVCHQVGFCSNDHS